MPRVYDGELVDPGDQHHQQPRFSPLLEVAKGYLLGFWIALRPLRSGLRALGLIGMFATVAFGVRFCAHLIDGDPPAAQIRDPADVAGAGAVAAETVKPYIVQGARQVNSSIGQGEDPDVFNAPSVNGRTGDALSPENSDGTRR